MTRFDTPIQITLSGLPIEILGTDTGSYVSSAGRTWPVASDDSTDAATIEARIAAFVANPPAVTAPVPAEVTPLQMRRALNTAGLRGTVENAVALADQDARDAWEFASVIRRDDPILAAMSAALGKTPAEIDGLFILAASF